MTSDINYDVLVERDALAQMRDGTKLAADIYRPDTSERCPAVLVRTPYDKVLRVEEYGDFLPRNGYALVLQDVRGRFASEGVFTQNVDDGWGENQDGYDSVEWVSKLPWCNGQVAVTGISAPASSATLMMPTQPPHLSAGVLEIGGSVVDSYIYRFYNGGVFRLWVLRWLLNTIAPDVVAREEPDPVKRQRALAELETLQLDPVAMDNAFLALPLLPPTVVGDLDAPGLHFWNDWLTNQTHNDYWETISAMSRVDRFNVPLAHITGWFDIGVQGAIDCFNAVQAGGAEGARGQQRLVVGPWVHAHDLWVDEAGELTFPGGRLDGRDGYLLRYFDTYVKSLPTGMRDEPPILIYVMGENTWRSESEWPLARTEYVMYYLRDGVGDSGAESLNGNKLLSTQPPTTAEAPDRYDYDPANPITTIAGRNLYRNNGPREFNGPRDCRNTERRSLTFTTAPLEEDVEVTGQVGAVIYAASSATDTDWIVTLTDVHPDGRSIWVAEGILRARFRDSLESPTLIEPGQVYEYKIDMWATSQVFLRGHCIRVVINSSDFPHYARNLNTGMDNHTTTEMVVARQTVFHDSTRPSHVVLPVIPR